MNFLHVGDLHLGYRQYGIKAREEDILKAHDTIVQHVITNASEYDAVVYAGDLFEKPIRSSSLELYLKNSVQKMLDAGVRVLAISGNHDLSQDNSTAAICGIQPLNEISITIKDCTIYGINYCSSQELGVKLSEVPENTDILVMHQTLAEVCSIASDISAEDLVKIVKPKGVRYIAMGHIHNKWVYDYDGVKIAYPGSIEMTDIDEPPEKFVLSVNIDKSSVKITELPLNIRGFERVVLTTDSDIDLFLKEGFKGKNGKLIVAAVARTLSKRIPSLEHAADKANVLFHVNKLFDPLNPDSISIRAFERAKMASGLKDVITLTRFKEGTEEYALILQLLERPSEIATVCNEFYAKMVN